MKDKIAEKWLAKKARKTQYWQIKNFLDALRLNFFEHGKGKPNYCISVPLFGMRFRFNGFEEPEDQGWKVFLISKKKMEAEPVYFRDEVMWYLVEKGYFTYIYEAEVGGNGRIFRSFIIDAGWGRKIIEKRIELCRDKPENTFMRVRMEEYIKQPMPKIISLYPGFFGYLF